MNRAPWIALVVAAALWEAVVRLFAVPKYIFPSLTAVAGEMVNNWGIVLANAGITATEALLGAALGCGIGFLLGCLMALNRWARDILLPYVIGSNSVPVVAVAPLVALWFGHGMTSKVAVAAFLCFFPLAINAYDGLRDRGGILRDLFAVIGAGPSVYFWNVRMPQAVPFFVSGAKVSVVLAVIGAVVAEFVGSDAGLGFGMVQASYSLNTPRLFAYVILACVMGLLFYACVLTLEFALRRTGRWDWAFGPGSP